MKEKYNVTFNRPFWSSPFCFFDIQNLFNIESLCKIFQFI